jgi:hypothetical protein
VEVVLRSKQPDPDPPGHVQGIHVDTYKRSTPQVHRSTDPQIHRSTVHGRRRREDWRGQGGGGLERAAGGRGRIGGGGI